MRAIFHTDSEWGIGKKNGLMFRLPEDMKFFRETTTGKIVVMGLNTLRSFPGGKPLKNRVNIVLSPEPLEEDVIRASNLNELFEILKNYPEDDVFVVGGASVYRLLLPYCSEVFVTKVHERGGADVFVPNLDEDKNFALEAESETIPDAGHFISFCRYKNLAVKKF